MDLHPILNYQILHLTWATDTHPKEKPFAWDMPMRAVFMPVNIHKAMVQWTNRTLGFLPPSEMDAQFKGRDLVLTAIQYLVTLTCDGKMWQQRFSHEFLGADRMATRLSRDGNQITNSGILFEPFEAHEVFDKVTGAAKHVLVMQFVS